MTYSSAEFLISRRESGTVFDTIPDELYPGTEEAAYAVQDEIVDHLCQQNNSNRCGYKLACTNPAIMELLNVEGPLLGQMMTHSLFDSGVQLTADDFTRRVVEPEFVFRMAEDVPVSSQPYDADSIKSFIGEMLPGIEIVDHRYRDFTVVGGNALIAENSIHGCSIIGECDRDLWRNTDLETHSVSLFVNGDAREQGVGRNVLGGPLKAMAWLANHLQQRGMQLKGGELVTTGTATSVYYADAGDDLLVDFGELGSVSLSFT